MTTPKALSGSTYTYWTFNYTYDNDGRLVQIIAPYAQDTSSQGLQTFKYFYDDEGRLILANNRQINTYYVYNGRGFVTEMQHANNLPTGPFNGTATAGTIPTVTNSQGIVTGDTQRCGLDDYVMTYDSLGNRIQTVVNVPIVWFYKSDGTPIDTVCPAISQSISYIYDAQNRLISETAYDSGLENPQFHGNSANLYQDNWSYTYAPDIADRLTQLRNNPSQSFNADDELSAESYDADGDQTSYDASTITYDANGEPISVLGGSVTPYTQGFTILGERAWKSSTTIGSVEGIPVGTIYYLYNDGHVLCELDQTGAPLYTHVYGEDGLIQRYRHREATSFPFDTFLYDPSGNLVHHVSPTSIVSVAGGGGTFVRENAIYDSLGFLHADIDATSGGLFAARIDSVGYKGQIGQYTDTETLHLANGFYTALSGPGGVFYNPESGVAMARTAAKLENDFAGLTEFGLDPRESEEFNASLPKAKQAFDCLSLIPGLNVPFTLCSAGVSAYQGQWAEAGTDLIGLIPDASVAVKGLRFAREAQQVTRVAKRFAGPALGFAEENANRGIIWVRDNGHMSEEARIWDRGAAGARAPDPVTGVQEVPALAYDNPDGRPYVKFDGIDHDDDTIVIDRKVGATTFPKQIKAIKRWLAALTQNPKHSIRVEVPTEQAKNAAERLLKAAKVGDGDRITITVVTK
jgi:YD repeat-containing protein